MPLSWSEPPTMLTHKGMEGEDGAGWLGTVTVTSPGRSSHPDCLPSVSLTFLVGGVKMSDFSYSVPCSVPPLVAPMLICNPRPELTDAQMLALLKGKDKPN